MQGAAIFSGPFLVGVLLSAQPNAPSQYSAVSLTAILAEPGFRSVLIGEHVATPATDDTQQPPRSEAGELTLGMHDGGITAIAVTSDGTVVSAGWHGTIEVWSVEAPAAVLSIVAHEGWVRAVAVTELDGRQVIVSAGGVDGRVGLWDLATGSSVGVPLVGHIGGVNALAVGISDGRPLAVSGGDDGTIRRWDLRALSSLGEPLRGHQGYVPALAVGILDSRPVIVSGGDDGTIRVWDLASGTVVAAPLAENPGKIEAC
jgi:WD40 repeat protein